MEVKYLILARYAEFTGDGYVNIIGGDNDKLTAEEYPYIHPMILAAARVVIDRQDSEREHEIVAVIVDADTEEIIAQGVSSKFPPVVIPDQANFVGTGLILPFRAVIFPRAGVYVVHLRIDDVVLAKARFRVAPMAYYQALSKAARLPLSQEVEHA